MLTRHRIDNRLRLGFALALTLAYLLQAAPHGHPGHPVAEPQPAHAQHAHHAHGPDDGHHHGDDPDAAHHHAFAAHLDHHFPWTGARVAGPERTVTAQVPAPTLLVGSESDGETAPAYAPRPPGGPPVRTSPPRAPPA